MGVLVEDDRIQIERLALGPFGTNTYILTCRETTDSVVVDAPGEAEKVVQRLKGSNCKYILMTHNHMDHVGALTRLKSVLNVPVAAHAEDAVKLPASADILLKDGDVISFGNIQLQVLHTPGHTPGSLCFLTGKFLIAGDTIFPNGPGKTGSPAAFKQIVESLTRKIFILPDDTQIYSGHGESTSLGREKQAYSDFASRSHDPNLCGDVLWSAS